MTALASTDTESVIRSVPEFRCTAAPRTPVPIGPGPWGERMLLGTSADLRSGGLIEVTPAARVAGGGA